MDQWLDFAPQLVPGASFAAACQAANEALTLRTFLAGHGLTVADVAVWGQLKGALAQREALCCPSCTRPSFAPSSNPSDPGNASEDAAGSAKPGPPAEQRTGHRMRCAGLHVRAV